MKGKIFNAQEVQSIISGNKRMFREVIKNQPYHELGSGTVRCKIASNPIYCWKDSNNDLIFNFGKSPYQVGQKIFCKESFEIWDDGLVYKADNSPANIVSKWKPAQQMKQEHSRLTLLIKEIRVERLAGISEEDIEAEGIKAHDVSGMLHLGYIGERDAFRVVWDATHKKPEEKFEANPWVWVVNFEVVK